MEASGSPAGAGSAVDFSLEFLFWELLAIGSLQTSVDNSGLHPGEKD